MYLNKEGKRLRTGRLAALAGGCAVIGAAYIFINLSNNPVRFKSTRPKVELGSQYDPRDNIQSVFLGNADDVTIAGNVNTLLTGDYEIDYNYRSKTYTIHVLVEDTKGPELELQDISAGINEEVDADSFIVSCRDASKVSVYITNPEALVNSPGTRSVEICAMDEYGNSTTRYARLTRVTDTTPPVILSEVSSRTLEAGSEFTALDLEIQDETDSSCSVQVDASMLDMNTPGTYVVTYYVKDSSGNETSINETIFVVSESAQQTQEEPAQ